MERGYNLHAGRLHVRFQYRTYLLRGSSNTCCNFTFNHILISEDVYFLYFQTNAAAGVVSNQFPPKGTKNLSDLRKRLFLQQIKAYLSLGGQHSLQRVETDAFIKT